MNKSFTFLHGTNLLESKSNYIQLFNQLLDIATTYRYALPTTIAHQDKNNYFSGWNYEILKPNNSYINSFYFFPLRPIPNISCHCSISQMSPLFGGDPPPAASLVVILMFLIPYVYPLVAVG